MNSYELQNLIADFPGLSGTEKLVGLMMALHLNKKTQQIKIKQETLARKCSLGERAVRAAIKTLVEKGLFERKRTFRTDEFVLGSALGKICGNMERHHVPVASGTICRLQSLKTTPGAAELLHSSKAEEKAKQQQDIYLKSLDLVGD